jgi:FAD/FMN-containing dehydrogenase
LICYGHLGDGSLHFNIGRPAGAGDQAFLARATAITRRIHDLVSEFGGSISAEHGIGRLKIEELRRYKSPVEIELMQAIKRELDPLNIMNPGKLL